MVRKELSYFLFLMQIHRIDVENSLIIKVCKAKYIFVCLLEFLKIIKSQLSLHSKEISFFFFQETDFIGSKEL